MAKDFKSLGWDYAVFALFLSFSILAPLWSRIYGKKKQKTKADYVFATGSVSIIAMMLSIARGTLGVRSILGYPSELFYRGSAMWEVIYGMVNAYPIVCFIFIPVYFNLRITSVYQYLDMRFKSRIIRCLASGTFLLRQMLSMGITVYTPGLALYTLLGIPYWASIIGMSLICIFFTVLGGLKAAINADVIQSVTVIAVTLAVIIRGTIEGGGPVNVFNINKDNGRLKFMNFTGDLTVRVDTLSAWLGQLFMSLSQFGCQQNFMQRYVSMKSLKEVTRVMMSNIPLIIIFFSLAWVAGMTIFATYVTCDPMAIGYIRKRDEILPFFIEDKLAFLPGFLGIFMATLFNGALSLNVSNLNSCATVIWEDFISQLPRFRGLSDTQQLTIIKTIAVVVGLIIMGIGFCVGMLTGVIESSMLAFSATCGPLLGVFVLAMLVPIANWKGASVGIIVSHILTIWLTFGGLTMDKKVELLETSTEGCSSYNFSEGISKEDPNIHWTNSNKLHLTNWNNLTVASASPSVAERTPLENMYALSYMYYSVFGAILTISLGTVISYLTHTEADIYDSNLLHPLVLRISEWFPGKKPYRMKVAPAENGTKMAPGKGVDMVENKEKIESIDLSKKLNPPKPTHPDIIDSNQYASKTGTYRKKDENDVA